ncbi:MAG TPA: hypothetical protein VH143_11390 [Kofleriaceae bacterium]|jgi:hypothetical protein|nr:hypothetical protein [Kofleriaceae bacterium]
MKVAQFVVLGLLAAGCGAGGGLTYNLAASEGLQPPPQPKDANCDFVIGKGPTDGAKYDKLGELTAADFAAQTQDDLKGSIRAQVCKLGGDYVIAAQDTTGQYKSVSVLRHHMDAAPDSGPVPVPNAPAPGPAPTPAPAGSGM